MIHAPRSRSAHVLARARVHRPKAARLNFQSLEDRVVPANPIFVVGTDAGSSAQVAVYDAVTRALKTTLNPFLPAFHGGVRVAVGDFNNDGTPDVAVAQGGSGANTVKCYDGTTFKAFKGALGGFSPFTTAEASGVWVAAGDVNGDGKADLVCGSDGNGTPLVRVYSGANGSLLRTVDVSALGLAGGVRVAAGDVTGDGRADVIVGGVNGASHVAAYDGGNGKLLYDYLPAGAGDRVGVSVAAGDLNQDGAADVFTGPAGGSGPVRVFGGSDTASIWNQDAFPGFTGGVRVGAADVDQDGRVDLLAAEGPGGGEVRGYAAGGGGQLFALQPFGAGYTGGLFVAGDARPLAGGVRALDELPVASVEAIDADGSESGDPIVFRFSGNWSDLEVNFSVGGTATRWDIGADYTGLSSADFEIMPEVGGYQDVVVTPIDDDLVEGDETIVVTVVPMSFYTIGSPSTAVATIHDNDGPPPEAPATTVLNTCNDPSGAAPGTPSAVTLPAHSDDPKPIWDASPAMIPDAEAGWMTAAILANPSMGCSAFSTCPPWAGVEVSSAFAFGYLAFGMGVDLSELPSLTGDSNTVLVWRCDGGGEYFDQSGGTYTGRDSDPNTLSHNTANKEFTLTDSTGGQFVFNDFDPSLPAAERGRIKAEKDAAGNTVASATYNGSGQLTRIDRPVTTGGVTTTTSTAYTYFTSGPSSGKASTIALTEQVGGNSPVTVRTADLDYYDGSTGNGISGNLRSIVVKDTATPIPNVLQTSYLRYYPADTFDGSGVQVGYAGGLKYAVTGAAYDRLKAWCDANATTVDAATDAQISGFADVFYQYDSVHRITRADLQGAGCTACSAGIGSYGYSYETSPFADGYNSWRTKTTETLPDGSSHIVYYNFAREPVLAVHQEAGQSWITAYRYDTAGRLTLIAAPSAVSGYDETKADLLNNQSGNYQFLNDSAGLISTLSYYTSTSGSISETTAGGVAGYLYQTAIQRGETGASVLQGTTDYFKRTAGGVTVYPVAHATQYRNANGTGGQTTGYSWAWNTGSTMPASLTVTHPIVTTGRNGSGVATSDTVVYDAYGRPAWTKDADGFITYTSYDDRTNAPTKVIQDVDTTRTSTFANLPSGWTTPPGGGLHLTTTYELDDQGRPTKTTSPNGNITYAVYKDAAHEVRVYPGWDGAHDKPTGPTQVYREDRAHGYTETLTMSAAPSLTGGRPDGTEAISDIQSLSRQVLNAAGQVVAVDQYTDLSGVTYSQSSVTLGAAGVNYLRTQYFYGKFGQLEKTVSPAGTITRTWFDGQVRALSTWVGTDDTPTTGFFSPDNLAGTDMVEVSATEYDNGGVGDSLVTKTTQMPGSPYANRETGYAYDWRDRLVATKAGVETIEDASVNRPILYAEYDNLGQAVASEQYDGDGLSITTDANNDGVPDRPSSTALRAKSTADFDELGRDYQDKTFSVDPSNGAVSTNALVSQRWFNSRGLVMKSSSPGGLVTKDEFDGVGRTTKESQTDGGGDSGYSDADDVTGDAVLTQTEWQYDADGNPVFVTTRDRFHDETGTGTLGTPTSGVHARVSYRVMYYDLADRETTDVDVGTNGGTAYTRPATPDARDDDHHRTDFGYNAAGLMSDVTDPKGLLNKTYYDLLGRTTKTIENYVDGVVSDSDDKTTELTYDSGGHQATLRADLTGGGYQETKWVYGITSPIVSNDVLKEMQYPDPSTGNATSSEKDGYTYNQLGEVLTSSDRNGTVHTYSLDVLGRKTSDTVTTLGSGVDGTVREIDWAYDGQGNAYLVTSKDVSGTVVNQVQDAFNGLGQLTQEWQATSGTVNTSTTPSVQYGYSFLPSGTNNNSRLTSITYPNGRRLDYEYTTTLADAISRLSDIKDGSTVLEGYQYLGLGTVVTRAHPQPGVNLTYAKLAGESDGPAGDQYTGLDRFGQVVDDRWTTSSGTAEDRFGYGYDRDGNRVYKENLLDSTRSELYAYDGLNQLTSFQRGTLNGTKDGLTGSASRSQSWDFDALGNFDSQTTDGTAQTRTANKQNEITSISGATTPTYDANGNLTTDETGRTFKYDAWNRLVEVRDSDPGHTLLATYRYDGLNHRVREIRGSTTTDLYYSDQWQVLEERVGGVVQSSYAWSPVYVDAMIARDRDTDGNGSLDERLYVVHDANFNITALIDTSGNVVERYAYDPFGAFTVLTPTWGARASSMYGWTYQHQGLRYDADLRAFDDRNRIYDPELGRFFQLDPIGLLGGDVNIYRFLENRPSVGLDPSGLGPSFGHPNPKASIAAHRKKVREAEEEADAALKTKINAMASLPCQKAKDKVYAALMELVKIAREPWYGIAGETPLGGTWAGGMTGFCGDCQKWQETYLAKMQGAISRLRKEGIIGCAFEVDGVAWENDLTFGLAGHAAIRIQFEDGTNIYLDDGNKGGLDHVFDDSELPNWRYTPTHPNKVTFIQHPDIRAKCKASGKSCLNHLCD